MKYTLLLSAVLAVCCHAQGGKFSDNTPGLVDLPVVPEDFEISLYAREPLVRSPCSLAFDARGRMFVSMGPQYRNPAPETPPDSVVILKDTDGDGTADQTHTFATGFNCVQGLAWHGRDLWVANAPDLTVVRDLDGDDTADEYVRVFTDLGNIEHGIHGLNWAPDGRLYMSKGNSKGMVTKEWKKDEPQRIAPKPFRELWGVPGPADAPDFPAPQTFTRETYQRTYQDPRDDWGRMGGVLRCEDMGRKLEIVARGCRNPYDVTFSDQFDWLGTDQDQNEGDRIIMPFYSAEFGWSHTWSTHWTGENHLPTVPVSGPVFTGSGTGIVWADAPNWPDKYRKIWIINDWLLKSSHIYRAKWQGALMQPHGGAWEDFIIGKNSLYRPVDMEFGPDGALYILGWGRGYGVERDKDGNMTNEGRIFRLMPKGAKPLPAPVVPLSGMSAPLLAAEFNSMMPVRRIDAQDELVQRGKDAIHEVLREDGRTDAQTTWLLWSLARAGESPDTFAAMAAERGRAFNERLQAIRILGFLNAPALIVVLDAVLAESEPRLRFGAVQAVHQAGMKDAVERLIAHAAVEIDRVTHYATWRALRDLAGAEQLKPLLADARAGVRLAALLALLDLRAVSPETLQAMAGDKEESVRTVAMLGLGTPASAQPAPADAAAMTPLATDVKAESNRAYANARLHTGQRVYTDRPYRVTKLPAHLEGAAMIRTANEDDASRGQSFLTFDLVLESTVTVAHDTRIPQQPEWLQAFSDTDLTITTEDTTFRLWSRDFPAGRVQLGGNLAAPPAGPKSNYFVILTPRPLQAQPVPTTAEAVLPRLEKGRPARGEALFFHTAGCAACHRLGSRGTNFGPDLTNLGDRMEAKFIIQSMLEPGAVITEGFSAHAVEAEGKSYFGVLLSTGRTLRLGTAGGQIVDIPEEKITKHETLPVSPMPPQGALLGPSDVADITAFLVAQRKQDQTQEKKQDQALSSPLPELKIAAQADALKFSAMEDRIRITLRDQPGADFVFRDPKTLRPHFANLHVPGGIRITRNHPPVAGQDPVDHPDMHPGLWLGFGVLNGEDFWRNKARIEHTGFSVAPVLKEGVIHFTQQAQLVSGAGAAIGSLTSQCRIAATSVGVLIVWDAGFLAGSGGLVFGDQEEMGCGVRVATALTEKNGGVITSSKGLSTAAATWGQPAAWCDYSGKIGDQPCGLTLFSWPGNFREPWWHNRDYGLMVANPFGRAALKQGEKSEITVKPGETMWLRFATLLHSGAEYDPAKACAEICAP